MSFLQYIKESVPEVFLSPGWVPLKWYRVFGVFLYFFGPWIGKSNWLKSVVVMSSVLAFG